jgi:hypothetical protein
MDAPENDHKWSKHVGHCDHFFIRRLVTLGDTFVLNLQYAVKVTFLLRGLRKAESSFGHVF